VSPEFFLKVKNIYTFRINKNQEKQHLYHGMGMALSGCADGLAQTPIVSCIDSYFAALELMRVGF
jgi:hypothetical protein